MGTIKEWDYQKILDDVVNWKIAKEEKKGLMSYADKRLGELADCKNPEGSLEGELTNLHQVLEYCCAKKPTQDLTTEVEKFKIGLTTGKIQRRIRKKDKKTGKYKYFDGGPHKDFRKISIFANYLKHRLSLPVEYAFVEEKNVPDKEKEKQRKLRYFLEILKKPKSKRRNRKQEEKKKHKLTYEKLEKIKQNLNTDWKNDYFYLARGKGGRFGETMQVELRDFDISGELVKINFREENSKTYGGEAIPIFNMECSDYLKRRIEERRENGDSPKEKFIQQSANGVKLWNIRLGKKLFGEPIRNKDFRDFVASELVNKKIITDRYRLCRYMSWELNSPMADEYIDKKEIDLEKSAEESLIKDKSDLKTQIKILEEKHAIESEENERKFEMLRQQNLKMQKDFSIRIEDPTLFNEDLKRMGMPLPKSPKEFDEMVKKHRSKK